MPEVRVELRDTTNNVVGDIEIFDSNDFPLALTYSNFDVRDLGGRKGSFSKSFKIPATKSNNTLLQHLYFDGYVDTNGMKSRKPATIYVDNLPIITGELQVTKIMKSDVPEEYECVFFGDNMDWASKIKDSELKSITYTHPTSEDGKWVYSDPTSTFGNSYSESDPIIYPLCSTGEGDAPQGGVLDSDFTPHIYVKSVFDNILTQSPINYSIDSQFLNSPLFKSLVMPLNLDRDIDTIDENSGKSFLEYNELLISAYYNNNVNSTNGFDRSREGLGIYQLGQGDDTWSRSFWFRGSDEEDGSPTNTGVSNGNIVTSSGSAAPSFFLPPVTGSYDIDIDMGILINSDTPFSTTVDNGVSFKVSVYAHKGGDTWNEVTANGDGIIATETYSNVNYDTLSSGIELNASLSVQSAYLNVNVPIMVKVVVEHIDYAGILTAGSGDNTGSYKVFIKNGSKIEGRGAQTISMNDRFDPSKLLPRKNKLEFIKGVSQLFNLQFHTDAVSKSIHIEPYNHFFHPKSKALDWSDKIDKSRGVVEEFIHDVKNNILFKYGGEDSMAERFNKANSYDYGSYKEVVDDGSLMDGVYEIENPIFYPTFMVYEGDYPSTLSNAPLIPVYWSEYSSPKLASFHSRPDKDFSFDPRILMYRNMTSSISTFETQAVQEYNYLADNPSATGTVVNQWGRATFIDWDDFTSTISDGFENVNYNLCFTSYTNGTNISHGLYKTYYSKMIQQLKNKPRIKISYFKLNSTDVMNFDFRSLIYIDGVYYRVNKIVDYKPHRNESTKVELVEFLDLGSGSVNVESDDIFM